MNLKSTNSLTQISLNQEGFTLIELVMVIAIIGIVATFAISSYQSSIIKSYRMEMMADMGEIGSNITRQKIAYRQYSKIPVASVKMSDYEHYNVTLSTPLTKNWVITAAPKTGSRMDQDGTLTLKASGEKCLGTTCGEGWKD